MQGNDKEKKYIIETVEIILTGMGRSIIQDIVQGDEIKDFMFDKGYSSALAKKYNENIFKLQGLPPPSVSVLSSNLKEKKKSKRKNSGNMETKEKPQIKIGENIFVTRSFATEEFLLNLNFHVVGHSIFDPYITEYMTSTASFLVFAFNANEEVEKAEPE
jgi:hypothetical protein